MSQYTLSLSRLIWSLMQTKQLHIRIAQEEMSVLQRVAGQCGLSATMLGSVLVKAGLAAVVKNNCQLTLPLELSVNIQAVPAPSEPGRLGRGARSKVQ